MLWGDFWFTATLQGLPIVSIGVPFFGLTIFILRILKGNPKKELQWRPQVGFNGVRIWGSRVQGFRIQGSELLQGFHQEEFYTGSFAAGFTRGNGRSSKQFNRMLGSSTCGLGFRGFVLKASTGTAPDPGSFSRAVSNSYKLSAKYYVQRTPRRPVRSCRGLQRSWGRK